jgi:hypothetical protein
MTMAKMNSYQRQEWSKICPSTHSPDNDESICVLRTGCTLFSLKGETGFIQ